MERNRFRRARLRAIARGAFDQRYNGIEVGGNALQVVPTQNARLYARPVVTSDGQELPPDQWVTRIVEINGDASTLVPVLRPLLAQNGHLAAHGNKLVMVDRFANTEHVAAIARALDAD